jgi:F0F1-type ATP synthase epsilon subunit
MLLIIQSPTEQKTFDVAWIEVEVTSGNLVIMPGHAPTVARLKHQSQIVLGFAQNKQEALIASSGIVEITRDMVRIILSAT